MRQFYFYLWLCPLLVTASPLERGLEAKAEGDFPLAIRELASAVQSEPGNVEAWLNYGTVLGWEKRYDEAIVALDRGLAIAPADYDLRIARCRVIAWQGNYQLAGNELSKLAVEYPDSEEIKVMQGRIAGWSGDLDKAEIYYRAVIARNPNQIDALTGLGDLAMKRKQLAEAEVFYRQAYVLDPSPDIQSRLDHIEDTTFNRIDFGLSASSFAGSNKSDWWSAWTQYSRETAWGTFWGRIEQGERFSESDTSLEVGWEDSLVDELVTRAYIGGSPDAFWAPNWYAETDFLWTPEVGWPGLIAEFRYSDYVPRGVWTYRFGTNYDFGKGWIASLRWVHQEFDRNEPTDGWILALDKEFDSGFAFRIGAASGAESLDGQSLSLPTQVLKSQTLFGGIRGPINDSWGWRIDLEYEDYDVGANRRGVSIGINHKF